MRAALLVVWVLVGCGTTQIDAARATLTTTAYAAVTADKSFAEAYRLASDAARDASPTLEEKQARMRDWDAAADQVERTVSAVYAGLAAAEIGVDSWERTGDATAWTEALACLADDLRELAAVLRERGLTIPGPLSTILEHVQGVGCGQ